MRIHELIASYSRRQVGQQVKQSPVTDYLRPQVTTLGQPLEVIKTQMAANRSQSMGQALQSVWARGGFVGFFQGLIPWARISNA